MRLERLVARGFRNLEDLDLPFPADGIVLLGANGQGKTNLLEAIYYPVLFRSLRGAGDQEIARFGGPGFHVAVEVAAAGGHEAVGATWTGPRSRKRITADGVDVTRLSDAVGAWTAVAFLPGDVALASGGAGERRQYLDRMLSLADRRYLRALARYRAALAQRNSALRLCRPELAAAFDGPLAEAGSVVVAARVEWAEGAGERFSRELTELGESEPGTLSYRGKAELSDVDAWPEALHAVRPRDAARRMTTIGPHRDDLVLEVGGGELRAFGSTGQQRSAAIALKLLELETLGRARDDEPALILDDAFAELDRGRQQRLAERLMQRGRRQVFLTAPRPDEMPEGVDLPVWEMKNGRVATR